MGSDGVLAGSVAWRLDRILADGRTLEIHFNEYNLGGALSTQDVRVRETPTQVEIEVFQRIVLPADADPMFLGTDEDVRLEAPLGDRDVIHAPVDDTMAEWGTIPVEHEPVYGDDRPSVS